MCTIYIKQFSYFYYDKDKEIKKTIEQVAKVIKDDVKKNFEEVIQNIDTGFEDATNYIKNELNKKIEIIKTLSFENFQRFCEILLFIVSLMIKNTEDENIFKKDANRFWEEHKDERINMEVDWFQPKLQEHFIDRFGIDNIFKEPERIRDNTGLELLKKYEPQAYQLQKYTRCGLLLGYDYRLKNIHSEFLRHAIYETFQIVSEGDKILFKAVIMGNVIRPSQL